MASVKDPHTRGLDLGRELLIDNFAGGGTTEAHLGAHSIQAPLSTVAAGGTHRALVGAHLITIGYGERTNQAPRAQDIEKPLGTVVAAPKHTLVAACFE